LQWISTHSVSEPGAIISIQQGGEVEVTLTIQGQTKIGAIIGQVSSVANRDIGIRFPNEEG
jgi:hypothetical protein